MRYFGYMSGLWILTVGLLFGCVKKDEKSGGEAAGEEVEDDFFAEKDSVPKLTPKPPTDADLVRIAAIQYRPKDFESSEDRLVVWTRLSNGKDERILGESPDDYQGPLWLTKSLDTMVYVRECKSEERAHPRMDYCVFLYDFRTKEKKTLLNKHVRHYFTTGVMFETPTKEEARVSLFPDHTFLDLPNSIFYVQGTSYTHAINLKSGAVTSRSVASSTRVHLGKGRFLLGINKSSGVPSKMGEYDFLKGKILQPISAKSPIQLGGASSSLDSRVFLQLGGPNFDELKIDTVTLYDNKRNLIWKKLIYLEGGDRLFEIDPYGKWMYFRRSYGYFRIPLAEMENQASPMTIPFLINHSEVVVESTMFEGRQKFRSHFALIPL